MGFYYVSVPGTSNLFLHAAYKVRVPVDILLHNTISQLQIVRESARYFQINVHLFSLTVYIDKF